MASSSTIPFTGSCVILDRRENHRFPNSTRSAQFRPPPRKFSIAASLSLSGFQSQSIERRDRRKFEAVAHESLDEWMRESVVDIVKNLREGPLMAQLYRRRNQSADDRTVDVAIERSVAEENWTAAMGRWDAGDSPVPEGLIFVEELAEQHVEDQNDVEKASNDSEIDGVTKAYGVVIQGRGSECAPACYLLKTSTAGSGSVSGCGLGCTHFCLVRVNGFRETTESQLRNCWLLQAQAQFRARSP